MLQVTLSLASPFVRKVRLAAALKGLGSDEVAFVDVAADGPLKDALRIANPLGKIPVARLADGTLMFDSHVICEYLDTLKPTPKLFPVASPERFRTLTLAALADGIMDASILVVYEARYRPEEKRHQEWVDRQKARIEASVDLLETSIPQWTAHPDYGHLALACALGYLDLRLAGTWRAAHPGLVGWLDRFDKAVPAWAATAPPKA